MNIFKQFYYSLFSPKDMASFRFQGFGKTFLYILLLTFISIIPLSTLAIKNMSTGVTAMNHVINEDFPDFTIENGQLFSDEKEVVKVVYDDMTFIFDSQGSVRPADLRTETNALAILKDDFVISVEGSVQSTSYENLAGFNISSEELKFLFKQMDSNINIILIILLSGILLFSLISKFFEITIMAMFGMIIRNVTMKPLRFRDIWYLSPYALTITTVFFTIMTALNTTVPAAFFINWGVSVTIMALILREIPKNIDLKA